MPALGNRVYRFLDCTLEPAEHRLSKAGTPIALTPKVFDTLVMLVERAGHAVSKDELMKALWPRGFVDESNLTKHIWLIRRALGAGEHDASVIETLPKLGYRFIAPVMVDADAQHASQPAPLVAGAEHARSRRPWLWASAAIAVALFVAIAWRLIPLQRAVPPTDRSGSLVAFVGFSNLSHNPKDAWLSPALTEMLGAELNVSTSLQVLPDELVRDASTDLAPPAAGGYAPRTLDRLRQRMGADYIVSGSYLVSGSSDDAPMRVDIALQDARTGSLVASVSQLGGESGLLALVASAGSTLRAKLGIARANSTGHPTRLTFDLEGEKVLLEEASSSRVLREKPDAGSPDGTSEAEKLVKSESDRILEGPRAPRPTFRPIPKFSDTPSGRELGSGVDLAQVQTEHDDNPVTSGRAYIYFWPGGLTERAYIQLKRTGGGEEALTVIVSPLTGRTKIEKGLVDMPDPRTDKEEDQGDREAF